MKLTHRSPGQTSIRLCPNINCKHDFQTARYGARLRVHTHAALKGSASPSQQVRCTVCGTTTEL